MARPLVVSFGGRELPLAMEKVERSDLYGYVEIETIDEHGQPCTTATLGPDGQTLIGSGGTAVAYLLPDGAWARHEELRPVSPEGDELQPVPSSFAAPVELAGRSSIEELLDHVIRSVYLMSPEGDWADLQAELAGGAIFSFPFSYRGGLQPERAFLLQSADGGVFMLVGTPARVEYVGLAQLAAPVEEPDEAAEEDDGLDFSMF